MTIEVEASRSEVYEAILTSPQTEHLSDEDIINNLHPSPANYNEAVDIVNDLKSFAKSKEGGEYIMMKFADMLIRAEFKAYINQRKTRGLVGGKPELKVVK